jgi:hypothetical protein
MNNEQGMSNDEFIALHFDIHYSLFIIQYFINTTKA